MIFSLGPLYALYGRHVDSRARGGSYYDEGWTGEGNFKWN